MSDPFSALVAETSAVDPPRAAKTQTSRSTNSLMRLMDAGLDRFLMVSDRTLIRIERVKQRPRPVESAKNILLDGGSAAPVMPRYKVPVTYIGQKRRK